MRSSLVFIYSAVLLLSPTRMQAQQPRGQAAGSGAAVYLEMPAGVALDANGNLYVAEPPNNCIRKLTPQGSLATLGAAEIQFSALGPRGVRGSLNFPRGVAVDKNGVLFVADQSRVYKLTNSGMPIAFAGRGTGFYGDGGQATSAGVWGPEGVAIDSAGMVYIGETGNDRVRKVNLGGVISTIAGNGKHGFSGDGGPATEASLSTPMGVAVDKMGNLYIADSSNSRVRKVSASGIITTFAGSGKQGFGGDGGPATAASLDYPTHVALDSAGNLYISDRDNNRIRKVTADGTISTVVGSGKAGFSGDGGQATEASIHSPQGLAIDAAGNIYFADADNRRVRKVTPAGVIETIIGPAK